jgi:hypothetical protein
MKRRVVIALKMEAVRTSETSVNFKVTTRRYIPEDSKLHTQRLLTFHKILRHGADGITSHPKEGVLRFIALGRFEHAKLGSNGKHANHYATEDDIT